MEQLTIDEIEFLIEGLNAYKNYQDQKGLLSSIIGSVLAPTKEAADENISKIEAKLEAEKSEQKLLAEKVILVSAKLIMMKDKAIAETALN